MRRFILWFTAILCPLAVGASVCLHPAWGCIALLPLCLWGAAILVPSLEWWGSNMRVFPTRKREALLTFDDGPDELETPIVLDLLAQSKATAVFFITGIKALRHPDLVRSIVRNGHALGVHGMSYTATNAWWWLPHQVRRDIKQSLQVIESLVPGYRVQWMRAPHLRHGPWLHPVLQTHGMKLMTWSACDVVSPPDFERTVIRLRRDINQGAIIALHHGRKDAHGAALLPDLVRELLLWLRGQGYKLGED